jgi:inorganic triphosphatase YgiF
MNSADGFEIEAKLIAPDWTQLTQFPAALEAMGAYVSDSTELQFADHYLDTADLHVMRAGWALRWRSFPARSVLTLKALRAPVDGVAVREEIEEEISGTLEDGLPVDILGGRVKEMVDGADLQLLFSLHQSRSLRNAVFSTGLQLEVCCDQIRWTGAESQEEEFVAELEVKEGTEEQLRQLLARLLESLDWKTSKLSKFERGMEVAGLASK